MFGSAVLTPPSSDLHGILVHLYSVHLTFRNKNIAIMSMVSSHVEFFFLIIKVYQVSTQHILVFIKI